MSEVKRGRPALPEAEKRQQIGVRTSPTLKLDLERAAGENGRSVAQEAELRLIESFEVERRAGTGETAQLLRMIADQIAMIERTTGKRWHRDLMTWAAAAEAIAKGPVQQLRPDKSTDDEVANEAWGALWAIIVEKQGHLDKLRSAGLHISARPEAATPGAIDALGGYVDLTRSNIRQAVEALSIGDDERDQLKTALTNVLVLDAAEREAEQVFIEAVRPFVEAEAHGRRLYAALASEKAARGILMSAARER